MSVESFGDRVVQFAPAQGVEEIAGEDDPLSLPAGEAFLDEMIDAPVHRLAHLGAEAAAAERRVLGEKLAVEPGRAGRGDLRLDREVRPRGERQALPAVGILVGPRLDDRAGPGVAGHLKIGEA